MTAIPFLILTYRKMLDTLSAAEAKTQALLEAARAAQKEYDAAVRLREEAVADFRTIALKDKTMAGDAQATIEADKTARLMEQYRTFSERVKLRNQEHRTANEAYQKSWRADEKLREAMRVAETNLLVALETCPHADLNALLERPSSAAPAGDADPAEEPTT